MLSCKFYEKFQFETFKGTCITRPLYLYDKYYFSSIYDLIANFYSCISLFVIVITVLLQIVLYRDWQLVFYQLCYAIFYFFVTVRSRSNKAKNVC